MDIGARNHNGETPLHAFARFTFETRAQFLGPALVGLLVELGADKNARDDDGRTPLHSATLHNEHREVVEALLSLEPNVNVRDDNGRTPLYYARNAAVVAALTNAGATL